MATNLLLVIFALILSVRDGYGLTTPEIVESYGYSSETHYITTEDGYILTFHRISNSPNSDSSSKKPPVLVMHGLQGSSANYVQFGPTRGLGFLLSDAGYDVWLGNSRGNHYSRNHTTLNPIVDSQQFFNFSWHEMGFYDLSASIDYILKLTDNDDLFYVGTSQGTTIFLSLVTSRPEYNDKIKLASLLAPAALMGNRTDFLGVICKYIDRIDNIIQKYKWYEFPLVEQIRTWGPSFCTDPQNANLCESIYALKIGSEEDAEFNKDFIPMVLTNSPSNSATKQYIHYGQNIKNGGFAHFDYGSEGNLLAYGVETPPEYDLTKVTAPVAVYYARNDQLIPYNDNLDFVSKLPNVVDNYVVPSDYFNHESFGPARDFVNLVLEEVLEEIKKFSD